jgi:hypothetical protein
MVSLLAFVQDARSVGRMRAKQYVYTAQDIADACLVSRRTIYRAIAEGWFDPKSLWSTYSFIEHWRLGNRATGDFGVGGKQENNGK